MGRLPMGLSPWGRWCVKVWLIWSLVCDGCRGVQGQSNSFSQISVQFSSDGAPQLAMSDLMSAYLLIQPNVSLSMTKVTAISANIAGITGETYDFAVFSASLTASQALAYPNVQMYPTMCFAVVPIYRIDALGAGAPQLILTRPALAQIYLGLITWWNDSIIQSSNPALVLPAQRITMVLPPSGVSTTTVWTTALGKFYGPFNSTIPISTSPAWPKSKYYEWVTYSGATGQASAVIANDGSLGYAFGNIALEMQNNVAALINLAGNTVQPTADAVTFAAVELGTAARSRTTAAMDLTDGTGSSVWPITMMSFLLIDTQYSRSTCHVRAAVVEFWLWYYSSNIALGLLGTRQYAPVPSIVLSQLSVVDQLSTAIMCRGAMALPTTVTSTRTLGAPVSVSFLSSLFANLYQSQDSSVVWEVQANPDQLLLSQFIDAEIDIAFVNPANVDATLMQEVLSDTTFLVIPTYLSSVSYGYNPQISSTVLLTETLTLNWDTIIRIAYGCILYWNDPSIIAQNPFLLPLLPPLNVTPIPITKINGCGLTVVDAPLTFAWNTAMPIASDTDLSTLECVAEAGAIIGPAFYACQSIPSLNFLMTTTEASIPGLLLGTVGSVGIIQAAGDPTIGLFSVNDTKGSGGGGGGSGGGGTEWTVSVPGVGGSSACVRTQLSEWDGASLSELLSLQVPGSVDSVGCWRGVQQTWAIIRRLYSSSAQDASGCTRGYQTLQWMQWFYATSQIDVLVESTALVRLSSLSSAVETATLSALNEVTCDGQTLLVTLPVPWSLASGVYAFVMVIASLGLLACVGLVGFVFHYRHHGVIRAASPLFLFLSIFGLMVLFGAGFVLVASVTTASCSALSWLVNVGLMLTFSPLFAKTWRIYRIFGRRKLSVVAISNRKLLLMVGALLGCEVVLMSVWQGLGNLQPQLNTVQTSTPTVSSVPVIASRMVVDEYVQCGVPVGSSRSMFIVICIEKVLLFIWGALMAFTTRKVSSTFNEAQGITLAIYNTLFTIGVIAPIILTIQATGDVLDLLLSFALLWISAFTTATLFGPKLLTVLGKQEDAVQANNSALSSSSTSGYQFMSLAALSTVSAIQVYLSALRKHISQVEDRLAKVRVTSGPSHTYEVSSPYSQQRTQQRSPSPHLKAVEAATRKSILDASGGERSGLGRVEYSGGTTVLRPRVGQTNEGVKVGGTAGGGVGGMGGMMGGVAGVGVGEENQLGLLQEQRGSSMTETSDVAAASALVSKSSASE